MINTIIQGHALNVLKTLPAESVNCCVTSPPYWNLRDYGVEGQLGLEKTFKEYISKLCNIFDEVKRLLRKDGTCWVNIGDSYGGSGNASGHKEYTKNLGYKTLEMGATQGNQRTTGQYAKSLLDIPYRFSIEMTNRGWIKRNTIIWEKPNCMPASANDRFTVDFEYLFFFTKNNKAIFWTNEKTLECADKKPLGTKGIEGKDWEWRKCPRCQGTGGETKINKKDAEQMGSPRARYHRITKQEECKRCKGLGKIKVSFWTGHDYWFEQQFEENKDKWGRWGKYTNPKSKQNKYHAMSGAKEMSKKEFEEKYSKNGRNKRTVWTIPTKPFPEAHFAVYPEKLIEPMIKAGCPRYVCKKCGKARVKIIDNSERINTRPGNNVGNKKSGKDIDPNKELHKSDLSKFRQQIKYKEIGYTDCGCNAGWEGGIVLDPFAGAGTTGVVAKKQNKQFIGIELNPEYIKITEKRIKNIIIEENLFKK